MKFLWLLLFLLLNVFNLNAQTSIPGNVLTVSYCDLINNSSDYNQKLVRVTGIYSIRFEQLFLYRDECREAAWVEFDSDAEKNSGKQILARLNKIGKASIKNGKDFSRRKVAVTIIARFDGKRIQTVETPNGKVELRRGYGHLASFNYQLYVLKIENAFSAEMIGNDELVLEKGVSAHKEIDAIYKSFSEAYRTLDVEKVAGLYTENAAYLPPGNNILQGREQIRPTFKSFFDWIKSEGRTMTISFQIFQRKVDKNLAFDVGIYTIRQSKDGQEVGTGQGKFVVVAVREKGGKWRFQVDGYSDLKPEK